MKRVVGILGSPRKGGNADILLDRSLDGSRSAGAATEKIVLNGLNFKPCQECGGCEKTGICVIRDDMRLVYETAANADGIAVASPVFFGTVSAQLKMMVDRFQCLWIDKYVLKNRAPRSKNRRGIFLCASAAERPDFFESSSKIVRNLFATLDVEYSGDLFCANLHGKAEVLQNEEALRRAFDLGVGLVKT